VPFGDDGPAAFSMRLRGALTSALHATPALAAWHGLRVALGMGVYEQTLCYVVLRVAVGERGSSPRRGQLSPRRCQLSPRRCGQLTTAAPRCVAGALSARTAPCSPWLRRRTCGGSYSELRARRRRRVVKQRRWRITAGPRSLELAAIADRPAFAPPCCDRPRRRVAPTARVGRRARRRC